MRTRLDPRRASTSVALIEAAESLFASFGVDGVSTRQLASAIGSSNTNVVAYYFGSKEALVEAVYRHRLPAIDKRRADLLRSVIDAGRNGDLLELLRAFALPLFEQTDQQGRRSYARFLSAVERAGIVETRAEVDDEAPASAELVNRIADLLPGDAVLRPTIRIRLAVAQILASLQIIDLDERAAGQDPRRLFDSAVRMAAAGLAIPPADAELDLEKA